MPRASTRKSKRTPARRASRTAAKTTSRGKASTRKKTAARKSGAKKKSIRRKPAAKKKSTRSPRKSSARSPSPESSAEELATKQRDISVSEFFAKNRHLLGFDNPSKALLTTVKEGVDNALDACEEARIVPDIRVEIEQLDEKRFRVVIQDNGPGIVKKEVPKIFGRLLYGSKFHRLRQSRGQQGIGISAAGMYGLLTTGRPLRVTTRTGRRKPAHRFDLVIDTQKNEPRVKREQEVKWPVHHGTRVEIELEGAYRGGQHSVDNYIRQIALANPHARLTYEPPKEDGQGESVFDRVTKVLPPDAVEIKPHPYGVELGVLMQMFRDTGARNVRTSLQNDFSRVSAATAKKICDLAKVSDKRRPSQVTRSEAEALHKAIQKTKIMNPPTDCIAPIGEKLIIAALKSEIDADFYTAVTRKPTVYRGNPFLIEVGIAYGGRLAVEAPAVLYRYANRVPLQYQQGACAITKAVIGTNWKSYQLQQPRGALPVGPALLMVHIASVWVPFTSESKEAIAHYPDIVKEIRFGLQECGRRMAIHVRKQRRQADELKKRAYIEQYIPQVAIGLEEILGFGERERAKVIKNLSGVLERSRKM